MNSSFASVDNLSDGESFALLTKKENVWFVPLLFFILNLIIKSFSVTKVSFDLDEAWHTYFSQKGIGEILKIAGTDPNGPFFNLFIHFWIRFFRLIEFSTRSFSLILIL